MGYKLCSGFVSRAVSQSRGTTLCPQPVLRCSVRTHRCPLLDLAVPGHHSCSHITAFLVEVTDLAAAQLLWKHLQVPQTTSARLLQHCEPVLGALQLIFLLKQVSGPRSHSTGSGGDTLFHLDSVGLWLNSPKRIMHP